MADAGTNDSSGLQWAAVESTGTEKFADRKMKLDRFACGSHVFAQPYFVITSFACGCRCDENIGYPSARVVSLASQTYSRQRLHIADPRCVLQAGSDVVLFQVGVVRKDFRV